MILGLVITESIVRPIRVLNHAARMPGKRKDELGDLSYAFNNMTASLEHVAAQRRQLIPDSAHELRTPVSLIQARIEMMEEGVYPLDADGLAALSVESKRLAALVDELRILSDLESSESALEQELFSLETLIREVIEAAEPRIRQLGIRARIQVPEGKSDLFADRENVRSLLVNLLSNALCYAESRVFFLWKQRKTPSNCMWKTNDRVSRWRIGNGSSSVTSESISPGAGIPVVPVLDFQFAERLPGSMAAALRPEARS